MIFDRFFILSSVEEPAEVIEEVLKYTTDDIYRVISDCSDKLGDISLQLEKLQETETELLHLLQSSFLDSLAALLLILVCYETMKIVRGWMKGVILHGRNR